MSISSRTCLVSSRAVSVSCRRLSAWLRSSLEACHEKRHASAMPTTAAMKLPIPSQKPQTARARSLVGAFSDRQQLAGVVPRSLHDVPVHVQHRRALPAALCLDVPHQRQGQRRRRRLLELAAPRIGEPAPSKNPKSYQLPFLATLKNGYWCQPPNAWTIRTIHAVRPFQQPQSKFCHHIRLSFDRTRAIDRTSARRFRFPATGTTERSSSVT
jgi:hypothetical protein